MAGRWGKGVRPVVSLRQGTNKGDGASGKQSKTIVSRQEDEADRRGEAAKTEADDGEEKKKLKRGKKQAEMEQSMEMLEQGHPACGVRGQQGRLNRHSRQSNHKKAANPAITGNKEAPATSACEALPLGLLQKVSGGRENGEPFLAKTDIHVYEALVCYQVSVFLFYDFYIIITRRNREVAAPVLAPESR